MKTINKIAALIAITSALSFNASAAQITYSMNGFGEWTPGSQFNSDGTVDNGVIHAVNVWNGTSSAGSFTEVSQTATFTKGSGTAVPALLSAAGIGYIAREERSNWGVWGGLDNSAGTYTYLTAKYGNGTQQAFYIGNVLDSSIKLPDSLGQGLGLSHVAWFTGTKTPSSGGGGRVPDGGTTLVSLGVALLGLGSMRKLLTSKA